MLLFVLHIDALLCSVPQGAKASTPFFPMTLFQWKSRAFTAKSFKNVSLINYLGLSYEQTVTSQLYLLVNHHRDCISLLLSL